MDSAQRPCPQALLAARRCWLGTRHQQRSSSARSLCLSAAGVGVCHPRGVSHLGVAAARCWGGCSHRFLGFPSGERGRVETAPWGGDWQVETVKREAPHLPDKVVNEHVPELQKKVLSTAGAQTHGLEPCVSPQRLSLRPRWTTAGVIRSCVAAAGGVPKLTAQSPALQRAWRCSPRAIS